MWQVLRQRWVPSLARQCRWNSSKNSSEAKFKERLLRAEAELAKKMPEWEKREETLRKRYGAWNPTRKLSRQQITDIRELKQQWPQMKTKHLADHFSINPESIRRILKSKWTPSEEELESLNQRAERRKLQSQERRLQAAASAKPTVAHQKRPTYKKYGQKPDPRAGKNGKNGKHGRKPFTVGVGDLID